MADQPQEPDFEKSLAELEALVEKMEDGDLGLEESLRAYERGVELSRACQRALDGAEQRIQILSDDADGSEPEPFEAGTSAAG